ncbi:hypothetical protein JD844_017188 [Phrynosoma platyrhinos]|uniref:Phosphodiesterase 4D interacting protein n=1 Tax=Phrynosoma platyrhinos TaxID=52577 RepID=A0ABQ7SLJ9_PHRPL|nr:hypothetical protein JD844_017188 [Phrynosoma platyrhinos]
MDVASSMGQVDPEIMSSLEMTIVENHLPAGYEQSSTVQTQTLRDFEKSFKNDTVHGPEASAPLKIKPLQHLNDLKKENFSLKLRIYFLEERIQQKYEASKEDVYRRNIELKVEVESLKRELQEKQENLDKAWVAVENSHSQNEGEICQQRKNEHACEILENKIHLLQEEGAAASPGSPLEVALRLVRAFGCKPVRSPPGSRLPVPVRGGGGGGQGPLEDKEEEKKGFPPETLDLQELWEDLCGGYLPLRLKNLCDQQKLAQSDLPLGKQASELNNSEVLEISCSSAANKQLQEKLDEMTFELRSVQHASQRQDHRIQHLNETLKNKENECEELNRIIGEQSETITKLQDMLHRSQLGQLQISKGSPTFQQQQAGLLNVQNTLFLTQLEVQRLKRAQQQKDRQLTEAKKTTQLLETMLQEEQQQKEAAWKHNKELCATLQQLKTELQDKNWQYCTWKRETLLEMERQEQKIKHLNHNLAFKEQLLQESKELLLHLQKQDKNPTSADKMVQRLQQRIKDRDAALEQAVDEKFSVLEDRERELQQLRLSVKEREHDLEGLHQVLSNNQAIIQDLESLLKSKDLELEHLLATHQNLQWLKEEVEAKLCRWQTEQEGELSATLPFKLVPGQRDIVEELCLRLHKKEKIIEELLCDKSLQTVEQITELQELLQAVSIREQQSHISSKKMTQALSERRYELQPLHQQLKSQTCQPKNDASTVQRIQKDVPVEALMQGDSGTNTTISERKNGGSKMEKGVQETTAGLEEELINAKEELELLTRKERESRLELSALQSVIASQEEELQVQASDVESLTRSIKIKEELIKDLQMQLVDPEEMPAIERLTQEVLMLQEKVASVELQGQEEPGSKRLQALEGLAAERNRLNETLKAEKQLYSSLVKFRAHPASSEPEQTLQEELEEVQALRRQLEEALGRSLERLSRLESLHDIGDLTVSEDAEDAGTEFTDSIEEEAAQRIAQHQSIKGDADDNLVGYSSCPSPPSLVSEKGLQEELLSVKSEIQEVVEQKKKLEGELQDLKGQIEEAGFSSVSQLRFSKGQHESMPGAIGWKRGMVNKSEPDNGSSLDEEWAIFGRKALLSLCLENAELKEQVGEAMLSEGWENEDSKEDEENLRLEVRKLQEKLHTSEVVIGLLKEQLTLNSQGGSTSASINHQFTSSVAQDIVQLQKAKQCNCVGLLNSNAPQLHSPPSKVVDSSPSPSLKGAQVEGGRVTGSFGQQFTEPLQHHHSELPQCRQHCHKLQDKLLVSEATIQAQMAQLEEYRALLNEPVVQQDSKQVQVDLQDLGYETCGRSENEADREETTSPECEDHVEEFKTWKKLLGSPTSKLEKHDLNQCEDVAILHQHIQTLQVQLQSSQRVIRNLQSRVHSISTTSDYASGGEHPLKMKQGYTLGSSSSHSITDEDEGWQSDSFGSFCPPGLQVNKDLARLIQRVSHLEALLGDTKPKLQLPEELKPSTSLGKYDSLVQAQARELSHLRQVMREGQGLCSMLNQHFRNTIKSFEELLRGTDIDYFLGQSFREQLAQGNQLAGRLARKLSSSLGGHPGKTSAQPSHPALSSTSPAAPAESLQRNFALPPSQDALMTVNQASREPCCSFMPLGPPPPPPPPSPPPAPAPAPLLGCCRTPVFSLAEAQQELQMLQKQLGESADLLEEHLSEIRMLRQRLEESICTNDHLREQLEARLASVVKTNELERLQAALLASHSKVYDGKAALEQQRIDQQRLQEEIRGKQQDFMQLQKEFLASQMNNSRLQDRVTMLQQQCEENRLLFQALQAELHLLLPELDLQSDALLSEPHGQEDLVLTDGMNKQGSHVIGHLKDYCTLQKQILEGKNLIHRMASLLQPALEPRNSKDQSMKNEIQLLRTKLAEQESHLQSNRDVKESMENFLLTHLTRTYDVLRKARTNLEVRSTAHVPLMMQVSQCALTGECLQYPDPASDENLQLLIPDLDIEEDLGILSIQPTSTLQSE